MEKNYYLGLDIGTNSCGFAVTDENYNIIKKKGKKLWGVRLFDEAVTAEERRFKRGARRRLDRRKLKLDWLQEIFLNELNKIDPGFISRLKYSNLYFEDKILLDKKITSKDSLFYDVSDKVKYTDKEYHKEYPTIFHLRKELLEKPAKDVRFLYLALHSIIKRRGNFLFEGNFSSSQSLMNDINAIIELSQSLQEDIYTINLNKIDNEQENAIINLLNENKGIKYTKNELYKIFNTNFKQDKKLLDILVDGKIEIDFIFPIKLEEKIKINFNDENIDEEIENLSNTLSEEQFSFLESLRRAYSNMQLKKVLAKNNYVCEAMVDIYNTHKSQLKMFKMFIKDYYPSLYNQMFRDPLNDSSKKITNYALYAKIDSVNGKKNVVGLSYGDLADRSKESFYKYVLNILSNAPEKLESDENEFISRKNNIIELIEMDNFLPKLRTKNNSIFPNFLLVNETRKILETNKEKFSFLSQKDESGLSNIEKIINILKFRIPYFVGPIGDSKNAESDFSWVEKKQNIELRPWTLNKIIDFDKAEDAFINKMTNKCTYLYTEEVLPKHSLVYSKFRVLNELNNLKFNGNGISVQLKQKIYNALFKNNKKLTIKMLKDYLLAEGIYTKEEINNLLISGIDKEFANQLSAYVDLKNKGVFNETFIENNFDVFENIIKYHTIISDKNRLIERVKREYPKLFSDEQLKVIKSLNYSNWGRLSYKFLCGLQFVDKTTGELTTVMDELWNTNQNLQQIIYNTNYTLNEELAKYNKNNKNNLDYQDVEHLYCSPSVKRAIWQTLQIINEIIEVMQGIPKHIFVEVTRDDDKKGDDGRKLSRQDNLKKVFSSKEFLSSVDTVKYDLDKLMDELNKTENNSLRSEKLYLYFLQLGKCAYSGEPIDLKDLYDEHKYDVDHIIPQSILKDDSLDNKVLVRGELNKQKSNYYPIYSRFPSWVNNQRPFWELLYKQNLMSKTKFERLVRKSELTDSELGDFISRQLVETNQSNKAVIDLLKSKFENQNIVVYSKARFVSEFRNKYKIYKSREVNDLHHTKDAYLNIVVGNVLYSRFTMDPRNFYRTENANNNLTKNTKKLFDTEVKTINGDELVWRGEADIEHIKQVCEKNDCLVSRMSFTNMNGAFYDETRYKSLNNNPDSKAKIQLKGDVNDPLSDVSKYGGYNNLRSAYFVVVESENKKGNIIKTIETVPIILIRQIKNLTDNEKQQKILEYIVKENNLKNAKLIVPKLNIKSTLKIGNGEYLLAGKTGTKYVLHNFNEWFIDNNSTNYVKAITKYMDLKKNKKDSSLEEKNGKVVISKRTKENNVEIVLTKTDNINLYTLILKQLSKNIYDDTSLKSAFYPKLIKHQLKFESLTVKEQAEVLFNIVKRLSTGAMLADLSLLGEGKNEGMITLGKNITGKDISLVIRSATGIKNKIIKL